MKFWNFAVLSLNENFHTRFQRSPRRNFNRNDRNHGYNGFGGSQTIANAQSQNFNLGNNGGASAASGGAAASAFNPHSSSFSHALSQSYNINGLGLSYGGSLSLANSFGNGVYG